MSPLLRFAAVAALLGAAIGAMVRAAPADAPSPAASPGARYLSGLLLEERRGRIVATRVLPGSPASQAGLKEGDVLLVIDDVSLVNLDRISTREVFRIFDRASGPSVRLVVGRGATTLGASLPLHGAEASQPSPPRGEIEVGQAAPGFSARDLKGSEVSLAALRGRLVLIDFWASWCPPCRETAIVLRRLADQYGDRLVIIGVSLDEDPKAFEAFVYNHHLPGHQIGDGGPFGPISVLYGAPEAAIPYSVLVAPDGTILAAGRSLSDKDEIIARLIGPPDSDH
ncbi:MAG TPA: redoxin domain-containing protein [Candidatus Cryosericum sp.]|nr:redoxin domain-containing protein [Candidatus Cryosericum sp.]